MILHFDDEPERVAAWTDALREAFGPVEFCASSAQFMNFLAAPRRDDLRLVVMDVMAPTPTDLDDRAAGYGTRTGVALLEKLREIYPFVPVFVLTGVRDETLFNALRARTDRVRFGRKREVMPRDLVRHAREMMATPD